MAIRSDSNPKSGKPVLLLKRLGLLKACRFKHGWDLLFEGIEKVFIPAVAQNYLIDVLRATCATLLMGGEEQ